MQVDQTISKVQTNFTFIMPSGHDPKLQVLVILVITSLQWQRFKAHCMCTVMLNEMCAWVSLFNVHVIGGASRFAFWTFMSLTCYVPSKAEILVNPSSRVFVRSNVVGHSHAIHILHGIKAIDEHFRSCFTGGGDIIALSRTFWAVIFRNLCIVACPNTWVSCNAFIAF